MQEPSTPMPRPFLFAIVVEGGIGLLAVALGSLFRHSPVAAITWSLKDLSLGGIAVLPLILVVWLCVRSEWRVFHEMLRLVDEILRPLFLHCRLWELAAIAAIAGLGEEMLFRGVIQNVIADQFAAPLGIAAGWIGASLVFGLMHWVTPTYGVLASLIGLYLGGLWIITGNLLVPAIVHALYDFWALVYLVRLRRHPA